MEKSCSLLVHLEKGSPPAVADEIKEALQGDDVPATAKIDGMQKAVSLVLNGENLHQLFITILSYVLPSEDHTIQKLLPLYVEIIDKKDAPGKILDNMILLIHHNLRNNLQHPNEYISGVTLRFLSRIHEAEIVEPLIPLVVQNLEHRQPFIRRNAIFAVMSIYKLIKGDQLRVNALEMIEKALSTEHDLSAKRNAFLMLITCAQDRAIDYLFSHIDEIYEWNEKLQMVVLESIRQVCKTSKGDEGRCMKIITSLMLNAPSSVVVYECAGTIVSLSSDPTALKAAANKYGQLLLSQSDRYVKFIMLERLQELKSSHREIMVDMVMDVLRALSSPDLDIRRKTVDIVLDLITARNVNDIVQMLNKEVVKTQSGELEQNGEYRQMLIRAIHSCAIKFPEVVHFLMDFHGDSNIASAIDIVVFFREVIETNPQLRVSIITRLLDTLSQIREARICSGALWIIGEYCLSLSEVESGIATIKKCLGELPLFPVSEEGQVTDASKKSSQPSSITVSSRKPDILSDGTYATQNAASEKAFSPPTVAQGSLSTGNLRSLLLTGDFFLGAVVACTLTKLVLRLEEVQSSKLEVSKAATQALLIMVSMLQLEESSVLPHPIDSDSYDRILVCIRLLCNTGDDIRKIWLQSCRQKFVKLLSEKQLRETEELKAKAQVSHAQPDDLIEFYHLKSRKGMSQLELEDKVQDDLKRAPGQFSQILQLTGFSDPVYAEAHVKLNHYDIVLHVTVINRTKETLQNLCLELATVGDLELVERPQNYVLAPESSIQIKANINVSSTETGGISGNIVFKTSMERSVVVLKDIPIDTIWAEYCYGTTIIGFIVMLSNEVVVVGDGRVTVRIERANKNISLPRRHSVVIEKYKKVHKVGKKLVAGFSGTERFVHEILNDWKEGLKDSEDRDVDNSLKDTIDFLMTKVAARYQTYPTNTDKPAFGCVLASTLEGVAQLTKVIDQTDKIVDDLYFSEGSGAVFALQEIEKITETMDCLEATELAFRGIYTAARYDRCTGGDVLAVVLQGSGVTKSYKTSVDDLHIYLDRPVFELQGDVWKLSLPHKERGDIERFLDGCKER